MKNSRISIINPLPKHFVGIQELCKRVYPFTKPWSIAQLESHRSYFPGGQAIAIDNETGKVVGLAFSLVILWDDYSTRNDWGDFTANGTFQNHNPRKGKTLYGAEVMVDPELRGQGIGKLLYKKRVEIMEKFKLKRIRAGARLRGYSKYKDQYSPQEYAIEVAKGNIYDPTLSFQLSQGFVVIDVVKGYLHDDPESLGYAAVIEYLNPKVATQSDIKKQNASVAGFMANEQLISEFLSKDLHRLVRKTTSLLGETIRELEGQDFFNSIEKYRQQLKRMRKSSSPQLLQTLQTQLSKETNANKFKIAHGFALQLELVNACEAAYRSWKLRQKPISQGLKNKTTLHLVLTSHPTEARSNIVVQLVQKILHILEEGINNRYVFSDSDLKSLIRLLWVTPLAKPESPTVMDEAEYLFSLVFSEEIQDSLLSEKMGYDLRLRTWVGGDKDGHPGVNSQVMKKCLNLSRKQIIGILRTNMTSIIRDIENLPKEIPIKNQAVDEFKKLLKDIDDLSVIGLNDGNKIKKWVIRFKKNQIRAGIIISQHHQVLQLNKLIDIFPAFVLPIELRESAALIRESLHQTDSPIKRMLEELRHIAGALDLTYYVRGFVISNCETVHDIMNATHLASTTTKDKSLPIIPLFESKNSLIAGDKILKEWLKNKANLELVKRYWGGYIEVMLGYSDSSKEIGAFPSRSLIYKSMHAIESALKPYGVRPVFFHGSGGSVARGGGSVKEQLAWWPNSAVDNPKMTIQGEMVQRTFATKEILNSHCIHFSNEATRRKAVKTKFQITPAQEKFASHIEGKYRELIADGDALNEALKTTPFEYLNMMKIGSRPSKRFSGEMSIRSLRAIPWILCWTQTRSLLPTWWGVGTAWSKLSQAEKQALKTEMTQNPFFSSFVKLLGFTLAKVELDVWKFYFTQKNDKLHQAAKAEYQLAVKFINEVTGEKKLIWYRPWLEESIRLRSPHIHILNLLQIHAMKQSDEKLLRETLVGISCGMLTTG